MAWGANKIWKVCSMLAIFVYDKPLFHVSSELAAALRADSGTLSDKLKSILKESLNIDMEAIVPPTMEEVLNYIQLFQDEQHCK